MVPLLFLVLLLSGCATSSDNTSPGYMPIPDQFIGNWAPQMTRSVRKINSIQKTPTGAIITDENYIIDPQGIKQYLTYQMTLNIFAIDQNRIYAVVEDRSISKKTGQDITGGPIYKYYIFEYIPPKYSELFKAMEHPRYVEYTLWCDTKLTKESMSIPASIHWSRMNNTFCYKTPQTKELNYSFALYFSKRD
ncbi:MAG: hypothetical protein RBR86_06080 [Pseudobdellovibrionaceae bacterium]|nr:hypothetical protein [Pseudobdellovibrionaceae bacterium]